MTTNDSAIAKKEGSTTVKVNLDPDRLKGKWQTLCIDLEKIVGSKFSSRFELKKLSIVAPGAYLTDVQA